MQIESSELSWLAAGLLSLGCFGCDEAALADEALAQDVLADEASAQDVPGEDEIEGQADQVPHVDEIGAEDHELASGTNYYVPVGSHDSFTCSTVAGWVKDGDSTAATYVTIHLGAPYPYGVPVTTVPANLYRADLPFADKYHGFSIPTPVEFKTGQAETMYIHGINIDGAGNWDVTALSPLLSQTGRTRCCGQGCPGPGPNTMPDPPNP